MQDCRTAWESWYNHGNNYKTRKVACEATLYTNSVAHSHISWYISTSTCTVLHHTNQQSHLIVDMSCFAGYVSKPGGEIGVTLSNCAWLEIIFGWYARMRMHTRICFALAVRLCWRRPLMWWRKVSVIALGWVWSGYIGSLLKKGSHFRYWLGPSHRNTSPVTIAWMNRLSVALQHSEQFHEGVPKEPLSHHSRKEHVKDSINPPLAWVCNHLYMNVDCMI